MDTQTIIIAVVALLLAAGVITGLVMGQRRRNQLEAPKTEQPPVLSDAAGRTAEAPIAEAPAEVTAEPEI